MFSIYGITGQVYTGTMEGINRVHPVRKSRQARPVEQEGIELGTDIVTPTHSSSNSAPQLAIKAYRDLLPPAFERGPLYHAQQVMQTKVITLQADASVLEAWHTLRGNTIHQAPVLSDDQELVGVVSERDLLTSINLDDGTVAQVLDRRVRDVMRTPVIASNPLTDIRRIASVMLDYDLPGVPIINERDRLVGFVSRSDLLRALSKDPPLDLWC
jgi:acetoin utilization protein AcuB